MFVCMNMKAQVNKIEAELFELEYDSAKARDLIKQELKANMLSANDNPISFDYDDSNFDDGIDS